MDYQNADFLHSISYISENVYLFTTVLIPVMTAICSSIVSVVGERH